MTATNAPFVLNIAHTQRPASSTEILHKYGITKKQMHSLLINIFHFPATHADCLSGYYLKHWQGEYLSSQIAEGSVLDNGEEYVVIYQGCTPYQVRRAKEVKLSFRKPKKEFALSSYVIVRVVTDADGQKGV